KRYREKVKKDPKRYTAALESARIRRCLRNERAGKPMKTRNYGARMSEDSDPYLPIGPFLEYVLDYECRYETRKDMSKALRIDERSASRWFNESKDIRFSTVDTFLTRAGDVSWWDLWPHEQYPEVHSKLNWEAW